MPVELYLKYFRKGEARGDLVAGFDLNSDRVNMAIVDEYGRIVDTRTAWFPEATSHGFPRNKAKVARLQALSKLVEYAYHHGVGVAVFEDLGGIKHREFTASSTVNREMSKFAKRQLLTHAIIMSLRYGLKPVLVDPRGTSSSPMLRVIMKKYGLDRHTASAYLIALKYIQNRKNMYNSRAYNE
ncbi:MAG: hypothetical protein QXS06_00265 [Desulfurococcaceae archaeon]